MPWNGRDMRVLRDVRLSTKVLILFEMVRRPSLGQRDLASILDVTPQAISDYIKHMEEEGLVEREGRTVRVTMVGFQFLQVHLQELGDFAFQAMRDVNVINSCAAIAGEDLAGGDPVVVELEDGLIVARKGKWGPSTGVAARDAKEGEDLAVRDLEGLLEHRPGRITIMVLPGALEGGTSGLDMEATRARLEGVDHQLLAVLDPVGLVAARKLGMVIDIRFGVDRSALDAALRGLDVLVMGGRGAEGDLLEAVEAHNKRFGTSIDYSIIELGVTGPSAPR